MWRNYTDCKQEEKECRARSFLSTLTSEFMLGTLSKRKPQWHVLQFEHINIEKTRRHKERTGTRSRDVEVLALDATVLLELSGQRTKHPRTPATRPLALTYIARQPTYIEDDVTT